MACFEYVSEAQSKDAEEPRVATEESEAKAVQDLKDRVLIVVGSGEAAGVLSQRRLDAGGRLCVVEANSSVKIHYREVCMQSLPDLWQPPPPSSPGSVGQGRQAGLAARFQGGKEENWIKFGPDVTQASARDELTIFRLAGGQLVGVQAMRDGSKQWEMSGFVVLNPTLSQASEEEVIVQDPEKLPFTTFNYRLLLMTSGLYVATLGLCLTLAFGMESQAQVGQLPWWRCVVWAVTMTMIIWLVAVPLWCTALTGFDGTSLITVLGVIFGIGVAFLFPLVNLSSFLTSPCCVVPTLMFTVIRLWETRKEAPLRNAMLQFNWGNNAVNLTVGTHFTYLFVALAYLVVLASGSGLVAACVLSVGVSAVEAGSLSLILLAYNAFVVKPRGKKPGSVHGKQRWLVVVIPAINHGWAEGARMAAVLAGIAMDPHNFSWLASSVLTLLLNVLNRTGWVAWLTNRLWKVCGHPLPYNNAVRVMNTDAKKYCGYPRFFAILAVMMARLAIFQELDPSKPGCAFWNMMTLVALLTMITFEVLEDVLVHFQVVKWPTFAPEMYGETHVKMGNEVISQMVALTRAAPGQGGGWALANEPGGKPYRAFSLHGVGNFPKGLTIGVYWLSANFTLLALELLFGNGFLVGVCQESSLSISQKILAAFVVETPYRCA